MSNVTQLQSPPTIRLYDAYSVSDGWHRRGAVYDGVPVHWIAMDAVPGEVRRRFVAPYRDLVADYRTVDPVQLEAVDELLTADEAEALATYLRDAHGEDVQLREVPLPLTLGQVHGELFFPFGGGRELYPLWEHDDYDLPVKIGGVVNLEGATLSRVRVCSHSCEHHPLVDEWRELDPPAQPNGSESAPF